MSLIKSKQERIRFFKFAFVGITGAIVDFGILNLFSLVLNFPLVLAQAISFVCAVLNNFLWNRYWTYPDSRSKAVSKQVLQFFIINIIGIAIRTPLIPWLDQIIGQMLSRLDLNLSVSNTVISQNLALAIAILIVLFWNYFANRYWTYNDISIEEKTSNIERYQSPVNDVENREKL